MPHSRLLIAILVLTLAPSSAFAGAVERQAQFLKALDTMMLELAPQTAKAAATVRKEYRDYLDLLVLGEYEALQDALFTGGLVPLPGDPEHLNVRVRTEGPAPIAEKDLDNQATYIAARPATVGALLEIASQVRSGPIEITSLVRHSDYQDELRTTNTNASTSLPMHTMGLAFDIALVNTPLNRVREIRDVLQRMQQDGELLVIGERKQLVFHVVPHPSRLGYFTEVYARAAAAALPGHVIDSAVLPRALTPFAQAVVNTEIIGFYPTAEFAEEWWAASGTHSDLTVEVSALSIGADDRSFVERVAARCVALVTDVLTSARDLLS